MFVCLDIFIHFASCLSFVRRKRKVPVVDNHWWWCQDLSCCPSRIKWNNYHAALCHPNEQRERENDKIQMCQNDDEEISNGGSGNHLLMLTWKTTRFFARSSSSWNKINKTIRFLIKPNRIESLVCIQFLLIIIIN